MVPCRLRSPETNCLPLTSLMIFRILHIFWEGNSLADGLANYGASHEGLVWWRLLPSFLATSYGHNLASMPTYKLAQVFFRFVLLLCNYRPPYLVPLCSCLIFFKFLLLCMVRFDLSRFQKRFWSSPPLLYTPLLWYINYFFKIHDRETLI